MNPSKGIWGFFGNELRQLFGKFKNHLEIKFKQMKNKKACKKKKGYQVVFNVQSQ